MDKLKEEISTEIIVDPEKQFFIGNVSPENSIRPLIVIKPLDLTFENKLKEDISHMPQWIPTQQKIIISSTNKKGPFALNSTPKEESIQCKIISENKGSRYIPHDEISVDRNTNTLSVTENLNVENVLCIQYDFWGISVIKKFDQDFKIIISSYKEEEADKIASLILSIITTNEKSLLKTSDYSLKEYYCLNTLERLILKKGVTTYNEHIQQEVVFTVSGQMRMTKETSDGFTLIKHIKGSVKGKEMGIKSNF